MTTMDLHGVDANSTVRIEPERRLTPEEFYQFCLANDGWQIEQTAEGEIEIMPPAGSSTSDENSEINMQLRMWAKRDRRGRAFDATVGFMLPNGATRSPDAAWISHGLYDPLPQGQKDRFPRISPEFIIELASPSDSRARLKRKMQEWISNGVTLGWLIDPRSRTVHVYRPDREPEVLQNPEQVFGEPPVDRFVLDLHEVWGES